MAIPLVGLFYQRQRRNVFLSKLEGPWNEVWMIFRQLINYLDDEIKFKEATLVSKFNDKNPSQYSDTKAALVRIERKFNDGKITFFIAAESARYKNHGKIRDLMNSILAVKKPSPFPDQCWEEFHVSCYKFLHGRGYLQLKFFSNPPYVTLEFKNGSWRATRTV